MAKLIGFFTLVADAEIVTKDDKSFGAFRVAMNAGTAKDAPVMYVEGYCSDKIAPFLKKGESVLIAADGIDPKAEIYTPKDGGEQKAAVRLKFVNADVQLGDAVYVLARGHLAADITEPEGKAFGSLRLLSNPRKKEGQEQPPVAVSGLVGEKLLAALRASNVDIAKGREMIVAGPCTTRAYKTEAGEARAEIRMGNVNLRLGRARKDAESAPQAPVPAEAGSTFEDDDIPF